MKVANITAVATIQGFTWGCGSEGGTFTLDVGCAAAELGSKINSIEVTGGPAGLLTEDSAECYASFLRVGQRPPFSTKVMDATLHALGGILLRAVPTFLLVILLHFYLKRMFFKPLERVLHKRYEATEGARKIAEQSMEQASAKAAKYESALRAAKAEVYQTQEESHKELQEQLAAEVLAARQDAERMVQSAKAELNKDAEALKAALARESDLLAGQIADSILRRSAA